MRKKSIIRLGTAIALLIAAGGSFAQDFNPVSLTPDSYTVDIVVESNAPPALPLDITATQGGGPSLGDATWYEIGFRPPPFNVTNGLPHPGTTITDLGNTNVQYVMPPSYATNDAFFLDGDVPAATILLDAPTTATNLTFLGSSGGGSATVNYTVNHADASTETGTLDFPDWFNNTPYAYTTSGRVYPNGATSATGSDNPRLYSQSIPVSDASPVTRVDLTYGSGGHAAVFALSGNAAGTAWTPIAVSGFNQDIVAEAMTPFPVNATMDQGTNVVADIGQNTWFEQGYYPTNPPVGLPPAGSTFDSASQPTHHYQMAPSYSANDAILIDTNHQRVNITPAAPASYSAFAVLTAGGDIGGGTMTNLIILQHEDGTSETNVFFGYDWYNNFQPVAFTANGRVNLNAPAFNSLNSGYPRLFESIFGLSDTVSPVTNIVVEFKTAPANNSTTYVLAVSAAAGAVVPVISTQPTEVNAFAGGTAKFNVTLSAGTQPLFFQWQKDYVDLSDGPNISGATSSNLVITGVSATNAGNYQLIITNNAGPTSSRMIPLTVMSTLPDVTSAGDPVTAYDPNGGRSPGGAGPEYAIDNTTSEFQDFGGNNGTIPFFGPVGFVVTPSSGSSVVSGLRVYSANTAAVCDPTTYMLEGSTDGVVFTTISSGSLSLPDARNGAGQPLQPTNQFLTEVDFDNTAAYSIYRVSFDSPKDLTTADSIRVGEVELLGTYSATAPTILSDIQTLSQTNYEGAPVTLSIQPAGTPTLFLQWMEDATAVPDATNRSYTFATLAGTHSYSCTVTNLYGSTNSLTAEVTGIAVASTTFVVNLSDYDNFATLSGGSLFQYNPYVGPGAYPGTTANDFWNGFGIESDGNHPYPSSGYLSDSMGIPTAIGYSISYNFNSGGLFLIAAEGSSPVAGTPGFLLGEAGTVNNGNTGTFTFTNVPPSSYDLYVYAANYDGDRGAQITVGGSTQTVNNDPAVSGQHPPTNFVNGVTYAVFHNVVPMNGVITGSWDGNFTNPNTGQSGEGNLCGLSLARVGAAPPQLSIRLSGENAIISWSPTNGVLQSARDVAGPYFTVNGATSPYTNAVSGSQHFFRVQQ